MECPAGWVLLLGAMLALPAAAPAWAEGESSAELDALIAKHRYERVEQVILQQMTEPAVAYFRIAKLYFKHEEWQRAARFFEKSLKLQSTNDEGHRLLGLAWRELHRPTDAEAELIEAAKENQSNRENAYFAGQQLLLNGKFEAALPYLYKALDSKPLQSQALQALAQAQVRLGNYGLAESYYRKAAGTAQASDDGQYSALVNLSILLLMGHDSARLEEALGCARQAGRLQPDSADVHFLAGKALFKLKRLTEAIPELTRAAELSPADSKPHFLLAQIYTQLGEPDRAERERQVVARAQRDAAGR